MDLARHLGVALSCEEDLSDEILVALYRGAEATLWPGCSESLTLLESMACGTPVLALRENEEFLAGELGGFLLPNKEEAFAEKISLLLRDLKLRDDLARKGRQWVQDRWDGESACERLMAQLIGAGETSTPQGTGRPKIRA